MNEEELRLRQEAQGEFPWKKWGPYLSERQWGTVREDLSRSGDAWNDFSHDQARSRAYRWGEDGLAGISDDQQRLCFALALWNGRDPILKERLFGLTNGEGNHGEDVKEYYYYLDNTPTHSYMKYLYKYPQGEFPYADLVKTNRARGRGDFEYELINTGAFDQDRYFDVFVEYAKATPDALFIQIKIHNRGPEPARLVVLPTLWFRKLSEWKRPDQRPTLEVMHQSVNGILIGAKDQRLGNYMLWGDEAEEPLFTENETNTLKVQGIPNASPYVKDGFHDYLIHGIDEAINPARVGTKVALRYTIELEPGASRSLRLVLAPMADTSAPADFPMDPFDPLLAERKAEADAFYAQLTPKGLTTDEALVMRQALAGLLWSKQYYFYDVDQWLEDRETKVAPNLPGSPPRNRDWHHMYNGDVLSMPDKWEYPWYASWDLAFHVIALTLVDPAFGKEQLNLVLEERYMHPNGQIPAYEWNFGDVNPPVQAWSTIFTYRLDKAIKGEGDIVWLKTVFNKLLRMLGAGDFAIAKGAAPIPSRERAKSRIQER